MINLPTRIPDCDFHNPALLDLFLLMLVLFYNGFSSIGKSWSCCCLSLHWLSIIFTTGCPVSSHCLWLFSRTVFLTIWEMFHRVYLKSVLLLLLVNFDFGYWLELMYISLIESIRPNKPNLFPWFSAACAAVTVHRNSFFRLYQKEKSSESKVKFKQASNRCKRFLEAAKLAYANKTKESITFQKLGSRELWRIANRVLNKSKYAIPPLFNDPEVLSSASDKAKLFSENFSKNPNLDDSGIFSPVLPSRTNLKLDNIFVTPKMVITFL